MLNFGSINQNFPAQPAANEFRILILADARGSDLELNTADGNAKRLIRVDRDNIDQVLAELRPVIEFEDLMPDSSYSKIQFDSIDSFHPDEIFERAEVFEHLRKLKRQLKGSMQTQAIEEIQSWGQVGIDEEMNDANDDSPNDVEQADFSTDGLFDDVLSESNSSGNVSGVDWSSFIDELIKPIQVQSVDPNIKQYEAIVDRAIELAMRKILDHPRFRAVESTWRGLEWLTRRIDSDISVKVFIHNYPKESLIRDLNQTDELETLELFRSIAEQSVGTPGGKQWSMVCALNDFGLSENELTALGRLGHICACAKTKLFTSIPARLEHFENETYSARWSQLVSHPVAGSLCTMSPRFLLRLPYGKNGTRTEQFAFEESMGSSNDRLWGNPSLLAASALASDFQRNQSVDSTQVFTFENFPMHSFAIPGMEDAMVAGERMMTDTQIGQWVELGITPVVSFKDSDKIQISGFQSANRNKI